MALTRLVSEQRQLEPSRVGPKILAGHVPAPQRVLDLVMHMFNGAGFLPVPLQQSTPLPIQIAQHGVMARSLPSANNTPWALSRRKPT